MNLFEFISDDLTYIKVCSPVSPMDVWLSKVKIPPYQLCSSSSRPFKRFLLSSGILFQSASLVPLYSRKFYSNSFAGILAGNNEMSTTFTRSSLLNLRCYSFYKISHKSLPLAYIGSTCHLPARIRDHQISSSDPLCSTRKLYSTIQTHGGWSNFRVSVVKTSLLSTLSQVLRKEQDLIDFYKPSMNSICALKIVIPKKKRKIPVDKIYFL